MLLFCVPMYFLGSVVRGQEQEDTIQVLEIGK